MAYKVKYKERNALAWELRRTIRELGLIDTGSMYDSIRISLIVEENGDMKCTISTRYYYFFLDEGTIHISPYKITDKWFKREKVQKLFLKIYNDFLEWYVDEFDILRVPAKLKKLKNQPIVYIDYNYIGRDTPSYLR